MRTSVEIMGLRQTLIFEVNTALFRQVAPGLPQTGDNTL